MNGTANISNFGGKVYTEVEGATLKVGSRNGNQVKIYEVTGKNPIWAFGYKDCNSYTNKFEFQVPSTGAWKNGSAKTDYRSKKGSSCYGFE